MNGDFFDLAIKAQSNCLKNLQKLRAARRGLENFPIEADRYGAARNIFAASSRRFQRRFYDPAATRDFHSRDRYVFNFVPAQNRGEFFGVIARVQFGTADQSRFAAHKVGVKVRARVSATIRCDQKFRAVKISGFPRR
jgi:hypothetical protein